VDREVGQDRRSKIVCVTPEGAKRAEAAPSLLPDRFHTELEKREAYEQTQVLATLQRIAAMMEAEDIEPAPALTSDGSVEQGGGDPTGGDRQ
jgi:hypothetical protein